MITCVKSGRTLDVRGGKAASGTNVQQYAGNGSAAQRRIAVPAQSDGYELVSALSPYLTLDVSGGKAVRGANVQLYWGNGTGAQRFTFERVG